LVRWAAVEAVQRVGAHTRTGQVRDRVAARRGRNIGVVAAARELLMLVFYGLRDHHIRALSTPGRCISTGGMRSHRKRWWARVVQVMTPDCRRRGRPSDVLSVAGTRAPPSAAAMLGVADPRLLPRPSVLPMTAWPSAARIEPARGASRTG
jgi:hypothetical protein